METSFHGFLMSDIPYLTLMLMSMFDVDGDGGTHLGDLGSSFVQYIPVGNLVCQMYRADKIYASLHTGR